MHKIIFALLIVSALSCNTNDSNATFTGFAAEKCGCCWGYEITLDNGDKVKADKFPEALNDVSARAFPFKANIDFNKNTVCPNVIEIVTFEEVPD
jgi:hypothetical protein